MIVPLPVSSRCRWLRPFLFLLLVLRVVAAGINWDLPAQPAADALLVFSEKSGYLVLFSAKDLAAVRSQAVQGEHEPLEALQIILAGSNFEAVPTGQKRVVVRARPLSRLTGVVRSGPGGAGLAGATVAIEGRALVAVTGRSGHFQLNGLPAGTYTVVISAEGMQTVRVPGLVVEAGRSVELQPVTLVAEGLPPGGNGPPGLADSKPLLRLEDMVVMPSRFGVTEGLALPVATMTHEDLEILPQLGEDLYRAIGRLPGLATADFTAKFWVRGAPYEQVLARLDGATLLEPFHMKDIDGALSIIDLETVARLNLTSGGFTAEYGDRLAGVLEMETESHLAAKPHTTLGVSLTGVRATSRGSFAGGKGDWLVSGRVGYPDIALRETNTNSELKPRYYDVFAKAEYQLAPGQLLAVHLLHSGDTLEDTASDGEKLKSSYTNDYIWARWRGEFGEKLKQETVLSYAWLGWHRHGTGRIDGFLPFELSDDRKLNLADLRQDWSVLLADRWLLRTGFEVQDGDADYEYHRLRSLSVLSNGEITIQPRVIDRDPDPHRLSTAAYVALRFQPVPRLTVEPGLRFDRSYYDGAGSGWSPRFNGAYDFGRATLRLAWGRYRQEEGLQEIGVKDGESVLHPAEEAEQRVLGLETRLGARTNFRVELYQRITENPRPHGENPYNVGEPLGELMFDRVLLRPTHAEAQGVEFILESRARKTFDWSASYVLSRTEETIAGVVVPRDRDQRHAFYCDVAWHPNRQWQFTAAWQYHTGWPASGLVYSNATLSDGRVVIVTSPGPLYAERLPAYHRLDLRATRTFQLRHSTLRAFVDVFNAYGHDNVLSYSQSPQRAPDGSIIAIRQADTLFPFLPSAGLIWDF
jgi:hypothetical protein